MARLPGDSAPTWFAYCPRCAAPLETSVVGDRPRRACPACGYVHYTDPKVGVGLLVVEDDRLLLVRRAVEPAKGLWSLPAGYLDQGEDPRETAAREALEETGLIVAVEELVDVFHNPPGGAAQVSLSSTVRGASPASSFPATTPMMQASSPSMPCPPLPSPARGRWWSGLAVSSRQCTVGQFPN